MKNKNDILSKIEFLNYIKCNDVFNSRKIVIGIDGKCGSGKSTLAKSLDDIYDIDVIRLDDFFLPSELRTDERLSEIGGNVHYERFILEVVAGIKSNNAFKYRVFSCKYMSYVDEITISNTKPILVEGSYSLREDFREIYDIMIFMDISNLEQKNRIISRNGEEIFENFKNIWIPKENAYFDKYNIREISDIIVDN